MQSIELEETLPLAGPYGLPAPEPIHVQNFSVHPIDGGVAMRAAAVTHVGCVRDHNEDYYGSADAGRLVVVADGMGGHDQGEVASQILVQTVCEFIDSARPEEDAERVRLLDEAILLAHDRIRRQAHADGCRRGMGATVAVLWIGVDHAVYAHVGDCRIYLARQDRLDTLTVDHNPYGDMVRNGSMRLDQYAQCPPTHIVTRSVGLAPSIKVELGVVPLHDEDRFMLCSDGLCDLVGQRVLKDVLLRPTTAADQAELLTGLALDAGGRDNITVAVIHRG